MEGIAQKVISESRWAIAEDANSHMKPVSPGKMYHGNPLSLIINGLALKQPMDPWSMPKPAKTESHMYNAFPENTTCGPRRTAARTCTPDADTDTPSLAIAERVTAPPGLVVPPLLGVPLSVLTRTDEVTVVLRKLRNRITQEEMMSRWPPDGSYNFIFLPYSSKQRRPSRYAFINFTSREAAMATLTEENLQMLSPEGQESVHAGIAQVQGLVANVKLHGHHASSDERFGPAVFLGTQQVSFHHLVRQLELDDKREVWCV
mmetsp:Transcript_61495/g.174676  ORF Transcript_61495/g.174676 Transcript_61495/m.174676 type:complete len:261 (-) Transcript_61495:57-839(-)